MSFFEPYAAKAIIQHEYSGTTLQIWITFRLPMQIYRGKYLPGGPFDVKPADTKWLVYLDTVLTTVSSSAWLDLYTILLTINSVAARPTLVTINFNGPDENLKTVWNKQWEAWTDIVSTDETITLFQVGMILIWHGSIATIPTGWALCDGTNGTPNLSAKFVMGPSFSYPVGDFVDNPLHVHTITTLNKTTTLPAGTDLAAGTAFSKISTTHNHTAGCGGGASIPPYYVLAYIMKL